MRKLRTFYRDERGMTLILVGVGFFAFTSAAMLAVDVGMLMVARSQAQNSADAGALAGAVALVFDNWDDRSAGGPAVQNALSASKSGSNQVMNATASVEPGDVTFPTVERIRVIVRRTEDRGNPVSTFLAPMIGIDALDISAAATAEVVPANAATCIKPWAVPDKWDERQTPVWDPDDELNMFYEQGPNKGTPLPNPDIYVPYDRDGYTGFQPNRQGPDYGTEILLKAGSPQQAINPSQFFPIALDGGTGADWYRGNINGCWPGVAEIGQMVPVEPGNMTGPTGQGTEDLIARDPSAYWDTVKNEVSSQYSPSPRIVVLPVFDPKVYESGRQTGRTDIKIANLVGFFIEDMVANGVLGRIVPMTGLIRGNGPVGPGAFLKAIRLVE